MASKSLKNTKRLKRKVRKKIEKAGVAEGLLDLDPIVDHEKAIFQLRTEEEVIFKLVVIQRCMELLDSYKERFRSQIYTVTVIIDDPFKPANNPLTDSGLIAIDSESTDSDSTQGKSKWPITPKSLIS